MDVNIPTNTEASQVTAIDPNQHLFQFLQENGYQLKVEALSNENPFIDNKGFVLTDRPLLVVSVSRKEDK